MDQIEKLICLDDNIENEEDKNMDGGDFENEEVELLDGVDINIEEVKLLDGQNSDDEINYNDGD